MKKYNRIFNYIIYKNINNFLKKMFVEKVILDRNICNTIEIEKEKVVTGKNFYRLSLMKILKYIFRSKVKMSQENIYIFVNEYNKNIMSIIEELEVRFKSVNIITKNLKQYKKIEEKEFNKGYLLTVSNNKRKGAKNAKYIINFDFQKEEFEKYNIKRDAIIINLTEEKNIYGLAFNGVIINDFRVSASINLKTYIDEFYGDIDENIFFENLINKYNNKKEIIDKIYSEFDVKITDLIGVRGVIPKYEFIATPLTKMQN